jgi:hypothetical protein
MAKKKAPKKKPVKKKTKAQKKISTVMTEFKEGSLPIGKSKKKVKSRKQALAIALDVARRETGAKIPKKKTTKKKVRKKKKK